LDEKTNKQLVQIVLRINFNSQHKQHKHTGVTRNFDRGKFVTLFSWRFSAT